MRQLSNSQKQFISNLLNNSENKFKLPEEGQPLLVGEKGSISFDLIGNQKRRYHSNAGNFKDIDGTLVDYELIVHFNGDIFELDLWKADYSPPMSFPSGNRINITTSNLSFAVSRKANFTFYHSKSRKVHFNLLTFKS